MACLNGSAQDRAPVAFGNVTAADFADPDETDSTAGAVVVADVGKSSYGRSGFVGTLDFYTLFREQKRVHIMTHKGFAAATVSIPLLRHKGEKEEVTEWKAITYNLENGKVVATEAEKTSIFAEEISENEVIEKFTFPAVREGSVIEYSYTVKSPFEVNLHSWFFQDEYPIRWSEYQASIPDLFNFLNLEKGSGGYFIKTTTYVDSSFGKLRFGGPNSTVDLKTIISTSRWVMKDVPAFQEEPYMTTLYNYVPQLDFQFVSFSMMGIFGGRVPSWEKLTAEMLKSDKFGADLNSDNSWLDKDIDGITAGTKDELDKAKRIFGYVRDHFNCIPRNKLLLEHGLKTIYKSRTGTSVEINLLLTAMLNHAKLRTCPVILSTRSHGFLNPYVPLPSSINYVVCKFWSVDGTFFLDASDPDLSFGQLPLECYNGYACPVDSAARDMDILTTDNISEKSRTIILIDTAAGGGLEAAVSRYPGLAEATRIRREVRKPGGEDKYREALQVDLPPDAKISDLEIDSLRQPDEPMTVSYTCRLPAEGGSSAFYLTPMLVEKQGQNPFKAVERRYPVEMPYAKDENYILTMNKPAGYVVEELPKSVVFRLPDSSGFFEYILSDDGDQIQFRTRLKLTKANYKPEEYELLRGFFAAVVKKEGEQIVFKKKK